MPRVLHLTPQDCIDIRNEYRSKKTKHGALAKRYKVSPATIGRILQGKIGPEKEPVRNGRLLGTPTETVQHETVVKYLSTLDEDKMARTFHEAIQLRFRKIVDSKYG